MTITVNNRELLRNYKALKAKLVKGLVDEIEVPQGDGVVIKIRVESPETSAQQWLRKIKKMRPIHIQRPEEDIF